MHNGLKLLTGLAMTGLVTHVCWRLQHQRLLAGLGRQAQAAMMAEGVVDGAVSWRNAAGWTFRVARLSGTADAATRARVIAAARAQPGIQDAVWVGR